VQLKTAPTSGKIKINIAYEVIMAVLAFAVLTILVLEYTLPLTEKQLDVFEAIDLSILAVFAVDYFYRLIKAPNKLVFFKSNIFDLIAIIPLDNTYRIARLARLTRLARLSRVSRLSRLSRFIRMLLFVNKFFGGVTKLLKTNGLHYMIAFTVVIIFLGAVGILHFESSIGRIHTFGDAIWWSLVTTTTVGYGDISPTSPGGRILAGFLMIIGIGFLSMVTGSIATFFVDKVLDKKGHKGKSVTDEQLEFIKTKLDNMENLRYEEIIAINEITLSLWKIKTQRSEKMDIHYKSKAEEQEGQKIINARSD